MLLENKSKIIPIISFKEGFIGGYDEQYCWC